MVRLYLDLETYRPCKEDAFIDERIISCGLLVDETPYCESSLKKKGKLILFNEWDELDERAIVKKVYDYVAEMRENMSLRLFAGLIFCVLMCHY